MVKIYQLLRLYFKVPSLVLYLKGYHDLLDHMFIQEFTELEAYHHQPHFLEPLQNTDNVMVVSSETMPH